MCGILFTSFDKEYINYSKVLEKRGPDANKYIEYKNKLFIFYRLSINDLSENGMQPFITNDFIFMCNGEIYNHTFLKEKFSYKLRSDSDCEIIPYLIRDFGIDKTLALIHGVFAFVYYDKHTGNFLVARDRIGIKSLYTGFDKNNEICFSSELKGLKYISDKCKMFPACHYFCSEMNTLTKYDSLDFDKMPSIIMSVNDIKNTIKSKLETAVKIRCDNTDRPVGCFLSGGLDSSLVAALVSKFMKNKIKTFSVGLEGATDLIAARKVADYIGSEHHELIVSEQDMLNAIPKVIERIETYDITTVRASTPMVLLSDWIKKNHKTTVIFSGEGADELSGSYKYFDYSPSPEETQKECVRLIKDLQNFDVLRCDKCVSGSSLEARVPFLDFDFVKFYMRIPNHLKTNIIIEKHLLRESFKHDKLLPEDILYRSKEAFSDGCSSVDNSWYAIIENHCNKIIDTEQYNKDKDHFDINTPISKESYWYRKIFNEYYPDQSDIVPYFWFQKWTNQDKPIVSARLI